MFLNLLFKEISSKLTSELNETFSILYLLLISKKNFVCELIFEFLKSKLSIYFSIENNLINPLFTLFSLFFKFPSTEKLLFFCLIFK